MASWAFILCLRMVLAYVKPGTTGLEVAAKFAAADPSIAKQTHVVVGANGGFGVPLVESLASTGARVLALVHNVSKMQELVLEISTRISNPRITIVQVDLRSLASTRTAAAIVASHTKKINSIFLYAGAGDPQGYLEPIGTVQHMTKDGLESIVEVEYFSQSLLADSLLPQMRAVRGRVIRVSSPFMEEFPVCMLSCLEDNCVEVEQLKTIVHKPNVPSDFCMGNTFLGLYLAAFANFELSRFEKHITGVTGYTVHPGKADLKGNADCTDCTADSPWAICAVNSPPGQEKSSTPCPLSPQQSIGSAVWVALAPFAEVANLAGFLSAEGVPAPEYDPVRQMIAQKGAKATVEYSKSLAAFTKTRYHARASVAL